MATEKKVRKSTLPYYAAALLWILWAVFGKLYAPSHFAAAAVLSIAVFLLLRTLCNDEVTEVPSPDPAPAKPKPTGNTELDKMIDDGEKAIREMKRLDDAIADVKISQDIRRMETVCQKIFDEIRADPSKLPQIRQFMDYYLPTTLKLLNAYDRAGSMNVSGENITGTKEKVENIMGTIVTAFEKQLDNLYGEEALDISTDISVMENMLSREGLLGNRLSPQTTQNPDGTDIKLEI